MAIAIGRSPAASQFKIVLSSSIRYGLTAGSYNGQQISLEPLGQEIVRPTSSEERQAALAQAALTPPTFLAIFNYYKGKKVPEATFFENAVIRQFGVPREHAKLCVEIFISNMEYLGLVKNTTSGKWFASEASQGRIATPDAEDSGNGGGEGEVLSEEQPVIETPKRQTTKPHVEESVKNSIFLGHGKNHVPLEQLKKILDKYHIPYKVAVDEPNKFRPISEKVANVMRDCGAGILIFTADEEMRSPEGEAIWRPSENVVFELGAASVLYNKIIIFKEAGVDFPSNFKDIGYITFEKDKLDAMVHQLFGELMAYGIINVTVNA
jgi:predicted nucleotide-binding protein